MKLRKNILTVRDMEESLNPWEYAGKVVDQIYKELSKEELRELDKILDKIDLKGISFK